MNDGTLAFEAICEAAASGSFLRLRHTSDYLKGEYVYPELMSRLPRARWESMGSKDLNQRAREKVQRILTTHQVELNSDIKMKLDEIVKRAERSQSEAS